MDERSSGGTIRERIWGFLKKVFHKLATPEVVADIVSTAIKAAAVALAMALVKKVSTPASAAA